MDAPSFSFSIHSFSNLLSFESYVWMFSVPLSKRYTFLGMYVDPPTALHRPIALLLLQKAVKVAANVDNTSDRGKLRGLNKELYDLIGGRAPIAETTAGTAKAKVKTRFPFPHFSLPPPPFPFPFQLLRVFARLLTLPPLSPAPARLYGNSLGKDLATNGTQNSNAEAVIA